MKTCPFCGLPMRRMAVTEKSGKKVIIYACPNRSGCGAIVQEEA